ncbi:hypothetical protein ACIRPQ_32865 [Streptomyces sp. NPDC101213]|uniref:hypothetical protein n=1 Tax=Streptomyces sp. NPDC101213 TaxID=3366130 RepID=UPI0037F19A7B
MEQSGTSPLLLGTVQDLAAGVVSALRGGGHAPSAGPTAVGDGGGQLLPAAVRVTGADLLLPHVLLRTRPDEAELTLFRAAVDAFPPRADTAPAIRWSHWAMTRALHRYASSLPGRSGGGTPPEPDASWLDDASWQTLTHQLAVLAPLALPGEDCAVARAARRRPVDVARGFVRAVRRRDWRQAAGAGRWLTLLDGVPPTLGLEAGLDFVDLMGGTDPRVGLQVQAARSLRTGVSA